MSVVDLSSNQNPLDRDLVEKELQNLLEYSSDENEPCSSNCEEDSFEDETNSFTSKKKRKRRIVENFEDLQVITNESINKETGNKKSCKRKRSRNVENWGRKSEAIKREHGLSYTSQKTGKVIPEKKPNFGVLCRCPLKCSDKFSIEQRRKMFDMFYSMDVNSKNNILFHSMILKEVKRKQKNAIKHKTATFKYKVTCDQSEQFICKQALCSLYQVGRKKIDILQKVMKDGFTSPMPDRRGKHDTRPNKIPEDVVQHIENHICAFPSEESHYSGHKNKFKQYLSPLLSVRKMYKEYILMCETKNLPQRFMIKESFYRSIFETKFNFSFGHPRSDTCSTCDEKKHIEEHIQNYHESFQLQTADQKEEGKLPGIVYMTVDVDPQQMPLP